MSEFGSKRSSHSTDISEDSTTVVASRRAVTASDVASSSYFLSGSSSSLGPSRLASAGTMAPHPPMTGQSSFQRSPQSRADPGEATSPDEVDGTSSSTERVYVPTGISGVDDVEDIDEESQLSVENQGGDESSPLMGVRSLVELPEFDDSSSAGDRSVSYSSAPRRQSHTVVPRSISTRSPTVVSDNGNQSPQQWPQLDETNMLSRPMALSKQEKLDSSTTDNAGSDGGPLDGNVSSQKSNDSLTSGVCFSIRSSNSVGALQMPASSDNRGVSSPSRPTPMASSEDSAGRDGVGRNSMIRGDTMSTIASSTSGTSSQGSRSSGASSRSPRGQHGPKTLEDVLKDEAVPISELVKRAHKNQPAPTTSRLPPRPPMNGSGSPMSARNRFGLTIDANAPLERKESVLISPIGAQLPPGLQNLTLPVFGSARSLKAGASQGRQDSMRVGLVGLLMTSGDYTSVANSEAPTALNSTNSESYKEVETSAPAYRGFFRNATSAGGQLALPVLGQNPEETEGQGRKTGSFKAIVGRPSPRGSSSFRKGGNTHDSDAGSSTISSTPPGSKTGMPDIMDVFSIGTASNEGSPASRLPPNLPTGRAFPNSVVPAQLELGELTSAQSTSSPPEDLLLSPLNDRVDVKRCFGSQNGVSERPVKDMPTPYRASTYHQGNNRSGANENSMSSTTLSSNVSSSATDLLLQMSRRTKGSPRDSSPPCPPASRSPKSGVDSTWATQRAEALRKQHMEQIQRHAKR